MNKKQTICPHCLKPYTLGVDGVVDGCDDCMAIVRNPVDHTVVEEDYSEVFEDTLTDMEKA
jgi:hypothetical protein